MHSPYTSDELFHFVGSAAPGDHEANYATLLKVLRGGRVSHTPHEGAGTTTTVLDGSGQLASETLIKPTVTCYADIPKECLGVHVRKYGHFGLGFKRAQLIKSGARPMLYVPTFSNEWMHAIGGRYLLDDIEAAYRGLRLLYEKHVPVGDRSRPRAMRAIATTEGDALAAMVRVLEKDILAFIKPFDSEKAVEDPGSYYMEREWRMYGNLEFVPSDLTRVWVSEGFAERLRCDVPEYTGPIETVNGSA